MEFSVPRATLALAAAAVAIGTFVVPVGAQTATDVATYTAVMSDVATKDIVPNDLGTNDCTCDCLAESDVASLLEKDAPRRNGFLLPDGALTADGKVAPAPPEQKREQAVLFLSNFDRDRTTGRFVSPQTYFLKGGWDVYAEVSLEKSAACPVDVELTVYYNPTNPRFANLARDARSLSVRVAPGTIERLGPSLPLPTPDTFWLVVTAKPTKGNLDASKLYVEVELNPN